MGGAVFTQGLDTQILRSAFYGNKSGRGGAIIFKTFQSGSGSYNWTTGLTLDKDTVITNNSAVTRSGEFTEHSHYDQDYLVGYGGGISFYFCDSITIPELDFTVNYNGALLQGNTAAVGGGGMDLQNECTTTTNHTKTTVTLNINSGSILTNVCTGAMGGGGVFARGVTVNFGNTNDADSVRLVGNSATNGVGGGFAFYPLTLPGGAVRKSDITLYSGEMRDNVAKEGGAVYLTNSTLVTEGGFVGGNVANGNGGAFYADRDSELTLYGGMVSNNTANASGGGFYAQGSTVSLLDSVSVVNNAATTNGGGFAVVCTSTNNVLTLKGGLVAGNVAKGNGGGFWIKGGGSKDSSISEKIQVRENVAKNGGGFYLDSEARLNINGGYVYLNEAKSPVDTTLKTVYADQGGFDRTKVQGCGGGFYLVRGTSENKTQITFPADTDKIGIYLNIASNAADDVLSEGVETIVQNIPTVAKMSLDYAGGAFSSGWYEDYCEPDVGYKDGTEVTPDLFGKNVRYRTDLYAGKVTGDTKADYVLTNASKVVNGQWKKYLCVTLGFFFPIPAQLWITDHEDIGNGWVNLQFEPIFTNSYNYSQDAYIPTWAGAAVHDRHLWLTWSDKSEAEIQKIIDQYDGTGDPQNSWPLALRDNDVKKACNSGRVWVTAPLYAPLYGKDLQETVETSPANTTNRYYKIWVYKLLSAEQEKAQQVNAK